MNEPASSALRGWESFYVIVGSSAGALTGLQFVVLTLITEAGMIRGSEETLSAFGSPNVVHFCSALIVSAILSAPWDGLGPPGVAIAVGGASGLVYSVIVLRTALRQRDYRPVLEDWIWHAALPMLAYAAMVHAGIRLSGGSTHVLYAIGGAALLLVLIGIHNAWDTVAYVTLERARERKAKAAAEAAEHRRASEHAPGPAKQSPPHAHGSGQHSRGPGPADRQE
jgi:hypothetical protein